MNIVSRWVALGLFLVICFAAARIGSRWTATSVRTWYPSLRKSSLTPPSWLFGPVWSVLYLLIALAAWLVWEKDRLRGSIVALALFAVQLLLNTAWSGILLRVAQSGCGLSGNPFLMVCHRSHHRGVLSALSRSRLADGTLPGLG